MELNIHPLIVHFPIGLLVVYALLEICTIFARGRTEKMQFTRFILLMLGVIGARVALQTGEIAEEIANFDGQLQEIVELHEGFANTSTNIFLGLAIAYIILQLGPKLSHPLAQKLVFFVQKVHAWKLFIVAALAGVTCLMITGALGGSLVYGIDADPMTQLIVPWLLAW